MAMLSMRVQWTQMSESLRELLICYENLIHTISITFLAFPFLKPQRILDGHRGVGRPTSRLLVEVGRVMTEHKPSVGECAANLHRSCLDHLDRSPSLPWLLRARSWLTTEWGDHTIRAVAFNLCNCQAGRIEQPTELQVQNLLQTLANGPNFQLKVCTAGSITGVVASSVAAPLARLTLLSQTAGPSSMTSRLHSSPLRLIQHVLQRDGTMALFRGNESKALRQIPDKAVQFWLYESLKPLVMNLDPSSKQVLTRMAMGGIAGSVGTAATYPLDMVSLLLLRTTYDSRSRTAVSLVGAGPADSQVNNALFCHTSWHSEVSLAARPGTLPQRVKNTNRLTARLEHL